jgi:RES domain-containing protein
MSKFASLNAYRLFADFVRLQARYVLNPENDVFLKSVLQTCKNRTLTMDKGRILWRSQIAHETEVDFDAAGEPFQLPTPAKAERMVPLADRAKEGRANPKGIPRLYVSDDPKTAMAEVRPWIGSLITLAEFEVVRDITLVDCTSDLMGLMHDPFASTEPMSEDIEETIWLDINQAFSEPVTPSDNVADYAPTQVLAEAFASNGFDGVVYSSSVGPGKNVVIFNIEDADITRRRVFAVDNITFGFSEVALVSSFVSIARQGSPHSREEPTLGD